MLMKLWITAGAAVQSHRSPCIPNGNDPCHALALSPDGKRTASQRSSRVRQPFKDYAYTPAYPSVTRRPLTWTRAAATTNRIPSLFSYQISDPQQGDARLDGLQFGLQFT